VRREVGSKRKGGDTPWLMYALFVAEETYRELKYGAEPTSRPVFLIRRDNTIFQEITYMKDGLSVIEMAAE
jgi:hypothetical protein